MTLTDTHPRRCPPTLRLGAVHLTVADLDRSVAWYQRALGLRVHGTRRPTAELGDGARPSSSCTRTRRRAPPAATPASTTSRCCTRPARSSRAPRCASRRPARRSRARPTTARTRRSTSPTPTATASSWLPTVRATAGPRTSATKGGPAPLDFDSLLATVAGEQPARRSARAWAWATCTCTSATSRRRSRFYRDGLGFEVQADLGTAAVRLRRRLPPPPRLQRLERTRRARRRRSAPRAWATGRCSCRRAPPSPRSAGRGPRGGRGRRRPSLDQEGCNVRDPCRHRRRFTQVEAPS